MHQRAYERYSPKSTLEAIDSLTDKTVGILVDISANGFMLASKGDHPETGTLLQLKLLGMDKQALNITFGARCLWEDEASAEDAYWSGFEIIDISPEDQQILNNYIESLKEND